MELQRTTTIPEVKKTIVMLRQLSADEKVRREAFHNEMRLHDEASIVGSAIREGRVEGRAEGRAEERAELIERWRKRGMTEEQIRDLLAE